MSFVPFRVQPSTSMTDNLNLINQNFNQVAETIDDFKPQTGTATGEITVLANSVYYLNVLAPEATSGFSRDSILFEPKMSFRIDTNDADHHFPHGQALTVDQLKFIFSVVQAKTPPVGNLSHTIVTIRNADSNLHQIFVSGTVKVYAKPQESTFR